MIEKVAEHVIERVKSVIGSLDFMERSKMGQNDFVRKRKLPFTAVVCFLLNSIKQTLQKEITNFIRLISEHQTVTKSAFCQQRMKLKPEAFIELNDVLVNEFYTDNKIDLWENFRLLSIDGSTLELPKSDELREVFGVNNEEHIVPMARISTFYDLLNGIILDAQIGPYKTSEYALALKHFKKAGKNDLLLLDRGFNAMWFFYYMTLLPVDWIVRLQHSFTAEADAFWESEEKSKIIEVNEFSQNSKQQLRELGIEPKPFKLRLVKVILDNGEIEVLATSLMDEEKYPVLIFKDLYAKRWGIETNYDHLKNHIEIGNFTGISELAIKQDFFANTLITNIQALLIRDAQKELRQKKKDTKYEYKINKNLSLGYMKDRLVNILTSNNPEYLTELKQLFQIEPIPIRKNRTFQRQKKEYTRKYYMNKKQAI